jgi:CheY-like chemotaxis protein
MPKDKVLIVDDDLEIRKVLTEVLRGWNTIPR